jgi:hypothetical protein
MKTRNGFVSNSSSASFLVIVKEHYEKLPTMPNPYMYLVDSRTGRFEFGWTPKKHHEEGTKMIFAYLQTQYRAIVNPAQAAQWLQMLEEVIQEELGVEKVKWHLHMDPDLETGEEAYIDHQSNAANGRNMELFADKETLRYFLFNPKSHIVVDNDNH